MLDYGWEFYIGRVGNFSDFRYVFFRKLQALKFQSN